MWTQFHACKQARVKYTAAILKYQQNRYDPQLYLAMGNAEDALAVSFLEYENAWRALSIEKRAQFPDPDTLE